MFPRRRLRVLLLAATLGLSNLAAVAPSALADEPPSTCTVTYAVDARQWVADGGRSDVFMSALDNALAAWSERLGTTFSPRSWSTAPLRDSAANWFTSDPSVDIPIVVMSSDHGASLYRDFGDDDVVGTAGFQQGVAIRSLPRISFQNLQNILIHELGHTLGLEHEVASGGTMAPEIAQDIDFRELLRDFAIPQQAKDRLGTYCGSSSSDVGASPVGSGSVQLDTSQMTWRKRSVPTRLVLIHWYQRGALISTEVSVNDGFERFGQLGNETRRGAQHA